MATEITPRFKPGQTLTAYAAAADIEPGRFVKPTAAPNADGQYAMAHAGAGQFAIGVTQGRAEQSYAQHAQERHAPLNTGGVVRMEAGAAVAALAMVMSDASGRAITLATAGSHCLGQALTAAAQAGDIIEVYFHPLGIIDEA